MSGVGYEHPQARLSYDALEDYAGDPDQGTLAQAAGVSRRSLTRWKISGVPINRADEVAIRFRAHPCEIWHDEWWTKALDA